MINPRLEWVRTGNVWTANDGDFSALVDNFPTNLYYEWSVKHIPTGSKRSGQQTRSLMGLDDPSLAMRAAEATIGFWKKEIETMKQLPDPPCWGE